jgi:chromosome segregation ATPase
MTETDRMPGILRSPTTTKSPTGVREIFEEQNDDSTRKTKKKNPMTPPLASKKNRKGRSKSPVRPVKEAKVKVTSPRKSAKSNKSAAAAADKKDTLSPLQKEFQDVKERIKWVKNQSGKDKEELYEQFIEEKARARKEIRAKFEPLLTPDKNIDIRVRETAKIIQYLRDDNARIRDEIQILQRMSADMKRRNDALEATNANVAETCNSLHDYVKEMEATHVKLVTNTNMFKDHLKTLKDKLQLRDDYFEAEANIADVYENNITMIISHVGKQCRDPNLIQNVIDCSEEAVQLAHAGKKSELGKVGLKDVPMTRRRRTFKKRQLFDIDPTTESDSDSDDDSDSDSDDE